MAAIPFAITSYQSDSLPLSAQRCINAYAEIQPDEARAKSRIPVSGSPGLSTFATIGSGPIRGFIEMNGRAYVVSGQEFYEFTAAGVATVWGSGITGIGRVSMDGDGFGIAITNGTYGFTYTQATDAFAQIADPDFNAANTVVCIDNQFAFDWKGTNKFFLSELLDGTDYDALSFASAESNPDRVIAVKKRNGILLIFGEKTIESWDHTGASSFPFQRITGATIDRGVHSAYAIEEEDSAQFFLGDDLVFYRLAGLRTERVSTHALEQAWQKYGVTTDAFCFKHSLGGHKFIYLTFPSEGKTFAYDLATKLWHERMSWDAHGNEVKWRGNCAITVFNKTLIGDANSGRIGLLDTEVYTEFGDPIVTSLTSPNLFEGGKDMTMWDFEVEMETGVGLAVGQGSDPQIMLEISDNGGKTFQTPQLWSSIGAMGDYDARVRWDRLGSFRQRVMRLSISDPVKRRFHSFNAAIEIEP